KGATVSHRNVVNSTLARTAYYLEPPSKYLLISPLSFDSSIAGLFWTLCTGGALHLIGEEDHRDVLRVGQILGEGEVTHMLCVPSLHTALLPELASATHPNLRVIIVAGEACRWDLVSSHSERLPAVALHNEYGPTEATVWATVARCEASSANSRV